MAGAATEGPMPKVEGTLFVAHALGKGSVREEKVPFSDLQGLLDACVAHEGAAFVRVEVAGPSEGERRRLVLDFGHFGRDDEE
jgi:hypothetical protein